jgi:hypothetical protein
METVAGFARSLHPIWDKEVGRPEDGGVLINVLPERVAKLALLGNMEVETAEC